MKKVILLIFFFLLFTVLITLGFYWLNTIYLEESLLKAFVLGFGVVFIIIIISYKDLKKFLKK